jgi:hypothetical protein
MVPNSNQKPNLKQTFLILLAVIAWLAVLLQIALAVRTVTVAGQPPLVGVINTLSYFTILTNLIVAIVSTASALRGASNTVDTPDTFLTSPSTMSAVAVYIFIVGLTYSLLLRSIWEPTGLNAVLDVALHDVTPILYVLFWFFFVPKGTLRWSQPLYWLVYPVLYIVYCIVRGAITGRYPYYFVDVTLLGYPKALLNTALLFVGFWIVALIVVAIDRFVGRFRLERTSSHRASA